MTMDIAVLGAVLVAMALIFISTLATGASPMPTSPVVRETILAVLPAEIDGPIYELGAGWGGLAMALAGRYRASPVRGFEVSILPWAFSRARLLVPRLLARERPNLSFQLKNFLRADLSQAALVVCFLTPPIMEKLKPKLEAELQAGALVVSNTFAFRGWQPIDTRTVPDVHATIVYLYRVD